MAYRHLEDWIVPERIAIVGILVARLIAIARPATKNLTAFFEAYGKNHELQIRANFVLIARRLRQRSGEAADAAASDHLRNLR
jgi:hypothetical protein